MSELKYCTCVCLGCKHFHGAPAEGFEAHHARLLLALDRSIAAACRSRGIVACDGREDGQPCEIGELHTKAAELARALAAAIKDPDMAGSPRFALEELLDELERVFAGEPRLT